MLPALAEEPGLYRIELKSHFALVAKTPPAPRGSRLVFARYPDGLLISLSRSEVWRVDPITEAEARNYKPGEIILLGPTDDRAPAGVPGKTSEPARAGEAGGGKALLEAPRDHRPDWNSREIPGTRLPDRAAAQPIRPIPAPRPAPSRNDHVPFTFTFNNLYLFDDNINHSLDDPHETRGAVFGLQIDWKAPAAKPNFEISYEIARHFHTADEWDRLSHDARVAWDQRLSKRWYLQAVGEVSLKGSTEDRDISDQYIFSPRLEYRFTRETRLRAYGAYRRREFDDDPTRNANNSYAGIEYVYRGGVRRADLGFRYEVNRADSNRHHYTRWSYYADYTIPVGRGNRLTLEADYRPRRYDVRRVRVRDHRELRFDKNWILSAEAGHLLFRTLEIFAGYRFETRSSNDLDKRFNEHSIFAGLAYRF